MAEDAASASQVGQGAGRIDETDRRHLVRCVELARQAVNEGHKPFGSILVSGEGEVLREDFNRTGNGDATAHPEFALAKWAGLNMAPEERARATVYTSGEHCPMCASAHALVGLGRIVFASSTDQLLQWFDEMGADGLPFATVRVRELLPKHEVAGPDPSFATEIRSLHERVHAR
ncbi:nucleoside deaminase [Fulvimarina endophytica]|uniref:Nucleoside deaminase n=2 Tax=Fulvimarina endophytica TaxID=2293836 RepID=A0A371X3I1_9HYPH|nr:nucleoside deaminase [Fulvimarina endophytica]